METLKNYDYPLPRELIAQEPPARRSSSRLMVLDRKSGAVTHYFFEDLPRFLRPGDVLVLNDTRVIPARLEARRETGGRVELFLLESAAGGDSWVVLARPSGRLKPFETLRLVKGGRAVLEEFRGGGEWLVSFSGVGGREGLFARGRMPLPRYIRRREGTDPRDDIDRERYQTVYAARDGAVAAPTAGLHFTGGLLGRIEKSGVLIVRVTLHVGAGTFAPVREEDFRRHAMHAEWYSLSAAAAGAINEARSRGGRIVAVGTTAARVLETAARDDGVLWPGEGKTDIYIYPPYRFRAVDVLVTNFHLPRSTLLLLVSAFAGRRKILDAYAEAVARRYRFYSYGDAMLIV